MKKYPLLLPACLPFYYLRGEESCVVDSKEEKRKLKSVEFWYDTKGFLNGKANVTYWE